MKILKRMTTVISRTVALVIVVGFFVNAGYAQEKGKGAGSDPIAQLYAGAKKEGTVIIWGPTDAIIYQKMQAVSPLARAQRLPRLSRYTASWKKLPKWPGLLGFAPCAG